MTRSGATITVFAPDGVPWIAAGDDLAAIVLAAHTPEDGDIVVLAQKIVSKSEGRLVPLDTVTPSARAAELAAECDKDPRLVELVLSETDEVMRVRKGVLIVRHRLGLVLANAGIDQSNIDHGRPAALLLPRNPDASAATLRSAICERSGADVAVLIVDSLGRAWRNGTTGTAIGAAGLPALLDLRGTPDIYGRRLETSELGLADEIAAAASLIMGQAGEGRPLAIVRGVTYARRDGNAAELVRPRALDLFP
ncbi:coenzyme F420-0:L-glutamate ligase [uncultured Sphingosinicella sp.]|jgi:coenzyme F420-0:L-glutamate ligase / coenzyme F420-1:gamma-L-glutamate ligase|uniref:coenzyme F420-0:L-glutamate ligase n=1 Tax=uncultured Sphingosinicella sp. TaxID=478748 RepID=UPI0030DDC2D6|tara:strand:+ start:18767 stop:19522 length:756 start_codon:yes stop_codon:yes gene_type:complete